MSKRLKLQLGGEAEMEERAFTNPYADYQPPAAEGAPRDKTAPGDEPLPFGTDGKVRRRGWSHSGQGESHSAELLAACRAPSSRSVLHHPPARGSTAW